MRKGNGAFKAATAAAAVALMVVAGCGSSDNSEGSNDSNDTTTSKSSDDANNEPSEEGDDNDSEPSNEEEEPPAEEGTLTVWMQGDTLNDINIEALNKEFEDSHPGITVNLQEQTWGEYVTKVATGLADTSDEAPDVIELGNTQVAQFAAEGALLELDKADFDNSDTWLQGLEESSTYDGKLIAVPYYAGVRVGIIRADLAKDAGVEPPYDSLDDMQAAAEALLEAHGDDGNYSGLFFPSRYWYAGMGFIWDFGGDIAKQKDDGSWEATLSSPESIEGAKRLKELYDAVSRNSGEIDEGGDATHFGQEQTAMIIDPTWMPGVITAEEDGNPDLADVISVFPVPGHEAGTIMPQFLGGSDIAINANTKLQNAAKDYTKLLTGQKYQEILANAGYIANSTSFEAPADNHAAQVAVEAASTGRFVPNSKNWTSVESGQVLQNYFNDFLTDAKSVEDAAADADKQINELLNAS